MKRAVANDEMSVEDGQAMIDAVATALADVVTFIADHQESDGLVQIPAWFLQADE